MWSERRFFSICHVVGIATLAVVTGSLFWFWMHEPVASGELRAVYIIEIALSFIGAIRGMLKTVRPFHAFQDDGGVARSLVIRCAVYLAISLLAAAVMLLSCCAAQEPVLLVRSVAFAGLPAIPLSIVAAAGSYASGRAVAAWLSWRRFLSGGIQSRSNAVGRISPAEAGATAILLGLALLLAVFDAESLRRHADIAPWVLGAIGAFGYETVLRCSRGLSERDLRCSSFVATCGCSRRTGCRVPAPRGHAARCIPSAGCLHGCVGCLRNMETARTFRGEALRSAGVVRCVCDSGGIRVL